MKKWVIFAIVIACVAGGAYVLRRPANGADKAVAAKPAEETAEQALPPVKADDKVTADGKVIPVRNATLSFITGGVVGEVLVKEGERVKAGQVLVRLDSSRQAAAVAQAEAQLLRAQAQVDELKAGPRPQEVASAAAVLEKAKVNLTRAKVASPPMEIAIAEAEVRSAQAQLDLVKAGARPETIAAAEAEVAAAKANLAQAKVSLAETELKAPFSGTVASLKVNRGEYIASGLPVLTVVDTSAWQVLTQDLTEIQVVKVKEGDRAVVTFDAIPNLELSGEVVRINPLGENRSGDITYAVTVQPARHEPRLRWNMTATVTILPND